MKLFLGVDGGQSRTRLLIGDARGQIVGRGEAGPCNHAAAGEGRRNLERAVTEGLASAAHSAGLDPAQLSFESACFGMSGGPDDKEQILAELVRTARLKVTHDAAIALAGATATGRGIIVIAGTGSIAFGRNPAGRTARAGGWGYVFGDEGGAFDIARQALRAALRMEEGWGPPTSLRARLLEATGAPDANTVLHLFYGSEWPRSLVARLAPLVDHAAGEADAVALEILQKCGVELAMLAASVRGQLWKPGEPLEVAYIGGAFQSNALRERFRSLVELEEGSRVIAPVHGPAEGALLEAYRSAGMDLKRLA